MKKVKKKICEDNNFIYPLTIPFIYQDTAFIGTAGWYDYSLRDKRLDILYTFRDYDRGIFGNKSWNDVRYFVWLENRNTADWKLRKRKLLNDLVFQKIFNQFSSVFNKIPDNINDIVVISHTAPFIECISPKDEPDPFDAYEGSTVIGQS